MESITEEVGRNSPEELEEGSQNSPVDLDEFLADENFVVRWWYRLRRPWFRFLVIVFWIDILIFLGVLAYELYSTDRFRSVFIQPLFWLVFYVLVAFTMWMKYEFNEKEKQIENWLTSGNQRRRELMNDEEDEQLRRLSEEQRNLPVRQYGTFPQEGGEELPISVVKEGEYSNVTRKLKIVEVHNQPAGSQESANSSGISGIGHDTEAIMENQDSSGTGQAQKLTTVEVHDPPAESQQSSDSSEISGTAKQGQKLTIVEVHDPPVDSQESSNSSEILGTAHDTVADSKNQDNSGARGVRDSVPCSNNPDCITVIQEEEENSEESPAKLDDLEESETKESTKRSSLMITVKCAEESDSQPDAEENHRSSLKQSGAVEDTLPSDRSYATDNDDESVGTVSSYSPHDKKMKISE